MIAILNKNIIKYIFIIAILLLSVIFGITQADASVMDIMKTKGCDITDLLDAGGVVDFDANVQLIGRSGCKYLMRSVNTWAKTIDFSVIQNNINLIKNQTGKDYIYSLNIAESIKWTIQDYWYPDENRYFNFEAMCKLDNNGNSIKGAFGDPNACVPSMNQAEYRKYLKYITGKAIDTGIYDFLFGQIYMQDSNWNTNPIASAVVSDMRVIASSRGKTITIGAQTNDIATNYLKLFDYIEGGFGQDANGNIESGPCSSIHAGCWALLWNVKYSSIANNVLLALDNAGVGDDITRFTNMSQAHRAKFIKEKYSYFTSQNIGFLPTLRNYLPGCHDVNNNVIDCDVDGSLPYAGCWGFNKYLYSPSNDYVGAIACRDEDAINEAYVSSIKRDIISFGAMGDKVVPKDYNGDDKTEWTVWRPSNGTWYFSDGVSIPWGLSGDIPVPAKYYGKKNDIAVWRPTSGYWYVKGKTSFRWGTNGDVPLAFDYDGDGKVEFVTWRPSNGYWYIKGKAIIPWGKKGDIPVPFPPNYDGESKADLVVWRPSNGIWYIKGKSQIAWGQSGDIPIPADYDNDGKIDLAVFRPSNGTWYILGKNPIAWGQNGDVPVPADYDGDGKIDLAVWRLSEGNWYILYGANPDLITSASLSLAKNNILDDNLMADIFNAIKNIIFRLEKFFK